MLVCMAMLEQINKMVAWDSIEGKIFSVTVNGHCYSYDGTTINFIGKAASKWLLVQYELYKFGRIDLRYFKFDRICNDYDVWIAKDKAFGRLEAWEVNGVWEVHREAV